MLPCGWLLAAGCLLPGVFGRTVAKPCSRSWAGRWPSERAWLPSSLPASQPASATQAGKVADPVATQGRGRLADEVAASGANGERGTSEDHWEVGGIRRSLCQQLNSVVYMHSWLRTGHWAYVTWHRRSGLEVMQRLLTSFQY